MGKTISMKLLFGIYLLLMAGKVFAFSCNVDGGSSIGAGTTSVYVNLDPVIQPGQNLVVDLSQHISCWNDYGGWYKRVVPYSYISILTIIPLYILCIIAISNPNNSFPHRISR